MLMTSHMIQVSSFHKIIRKTVDLSFFFIMTHDTHTSSYILQVWYSFPLSDTQSLQKTINIL